MQILDPSRRLTMAQHMQSWWSMSLRPNLRALLLAAAPLAGCSDNTCTSGQYHSPGGGQTATVWSNEPYPAGYSASVGFCRSVCPPDMLTCDACGEMFIGAALAKKLDAHQGPQFAEDAAG